MPTFLHTPGLLQDSFTFYFPSYLRHPKCGPPKIFNNKIFHLISWYSWPHRTGEPKQLTTATVVQLTAITWVSELRFNFPLTLWDWHVLQKWWVKGIHPKDSCKTGQYTKRNHELPTKTKGSQAVNHNQTTNGVQSQKRRSNHAARVTTQW